MSFVGSSGSRHSLRPNEIQELRVPLLSSLGQCCSRPLIPVSCSKAGVRKSKNRPDKRTRRSIIVDPVSAPNRNSNAQVFLLQTRPPGVHLIYHLRPIPGSCRPREKGHHLRSPIRRPVLINPSRHLLTYHLSLAPQPPAPNTADTAPTASSAPPPSDKPNSPQTAASASSPHAPAPQSPAPQTAES